MAHKFNVGDVVINLESFSLWDNVYHFKQTLHFFKKEVVVSANYRYFTTDPSVDLTKFSGLSDYSEQSKVCYQDSGRSVSGSRAYVNFTLREQAIRDYLQKQFDDALAKSQKEDDAAIANLEAEIRFKQQQIEAIKAGKRPVSFEHKIIERDFINERVKALLDVLNT